LFGDT